VPITVKKRNGQPDDSVTPTGTQTFRMFGPPATGNGFQKGVYEQQVAGASGTYRHIEDVNTPGVASPSTYTYAP